MTDAFSEPPPAVENPGLELGYTCGSCGSWCPLDSLQPIEAWELPEVRREGVLGGQNGEVYALQRPRRVLLLNLACCYEWYVPAGTQPTPRPHG